MGLFFTDFWHDFDSYLSKEMNLVTNGIEKVQRQIEAPFISGAQFVKKEAISIVDTVDGGINKIENAGSDAFAEIKDIGGDIKDFGAGVLHGAESLGNNVLEIGDSVANLSTYLPYIILGLGGIYLLKN